MNQRKIQPRDDAAYSYRIAVIGSIREAFRVGSSSYGVMHSPATGRIRSDLILTGKCDLVDTAILGFDSFRAGHNAFTQSE